MTGSGFNNLIFWIISPIHYYTFKIAVSITQTIKTLSRSTHHLLNCLQRRLPDESSRSQRQSQSQSHDLLYDWRFTANQFVLEPSPLKLKARICFSQMNTCGHSPYITSSLTRGRVSHLQLLLVLARTFSDPNPVGLVTIFYCP
jgi:hypothetical protein